MKYDKNFNNDNKYCTLFMYIVHDYPTKQSTSVYVYHNIELMLNEIKKCINKIYI